MPSAGSIKLPSPAPVAAAPAAPTAARSRLSQQVHLRPSGRRTSPDADEDAEGEDDVEDGGEGEEDGGDAEDTQIYCFCQKMSYGEVRARSHVVARNEEAVQLRVHYIRFNGIFHLCR